MAGCQLAGVEPAAPPPPDPTDPVVQPGPITRVDEDAARALYDRAEASYEARRHLEALRLTTELLERYPASSVSGAALLLTARAELAAGSVERADAAAERYIELLPPGDPRVAEARFFQVEALEGQPLIQLDRLLRIDAGASDAIRDRAVELVRVRIDALSLAELEIVAERAPLGGVAGAPLYARLAGELLARGEDVRAAELAQAALDAGAEGEDASLAEGVLRGELPDGLRPERAFRIATVLPFGGPPALAEYASLLAEGIEVAVATVLSDEYSVTLVPMDDQADPTTAAQIVAGLEEEAVAGAIGFLLDEAMLAGADARVRGLPIVSPTARSVSLAGPGAYSLAGADRRAARSVAMHAVSRAHQRVAMIYPATPEATEEANAFAEVVNRFGIPVVGRYTYLEGATDFEAQFRLAQDALRAAEIAALGLTEEDTLVHVADLVVPVGLFMPIPAEDVEFVGPQFAHHGLDTLAIEVLGTTGWTDSRALESVDPRVISGVVATASLGAGPGAPGYARFRQAYEAYYQRSLVSTTPALGYDATLLLLEALRPGRLRPSDVLDSFEALEEVEGATGVYSIVDGQIVRRTEVVRIEPGRLVPMPGPLIAPPADR